jgi:hypothetical protein
LGQLEELEPLEQVDLLDPKESLEPLAKLDQPVLEDFLVQQVPLVLMEELGPQDLLV